MVAKLASDAERMLERAEMLDSLLVESKAYETPAKLASFFAEKVIPVMQELRAYADEMELSTAKKYWPFPTYGEILFSV